MLIDLPHAEHVADLLREREEKHGAEAAAQSREEMLLRVEAILKVLRWHHATDEEVATTTDRLLQKNDELYRRLS